MVENERKWSKDAIPTIDEMLFGICRVSRRLYNGRLPIELQGYDEVYKLISEHEYIRTSGNTDEKIIQEKTEYVLWFIDFSEFSSYN